MNLLRGNSIKRHRQPQVAKIVKLRGPVREYTVAVGILFEGGGVGLLTICNSRVGAYSRGAFSRVGGDSRIYSTWIR